MKTRQALEQLLSEHSMEELLEMMQILGDSYLQCAEGGPDMDVIYQQRALEKFLKKMEKIQLQERFSNASKRAV